MPEIIRLSGHRGWIDMEDETRTCRTCEEDISRDEHYCSFYAQTGVLETPSDDQDTSPLGEWTFGRVIFALVEANTDFHARALGAAAFRLGTASRAAKTPLMGP